MKQSPLLCRLDFGAGAARQLNLPLGGIVSPRYLLLRLCFS